MNRSSFLTSLFATALLLFGSGCDLTCGPGTVAQGGKCIPVCGAGAVFDAESGGCVLDVASICPPKRVWDDSLKACTPEYDLFCEEGFVWSESTGACALSPADLYEGTEPNDPKMQGTATPMVLPDKGQSLLLGGVAGPGVAVENFCGHEGSVAVFADLDAFQFEASSGQLLRIKGISGGIPTVGFALLPVDRWPTHACDSPPPDPTSKSAERYSWSQGPGRNTLRFVQIVEDGTYVLLVSDRVNMDPDIASYHVSGGEDFDYRIEVTVLESEPTVSPALGTAVKVDASPSAPPMVVTASGLSPGSLMRAWVSDPVNRVDYDNQYSVPPNRSLYLMDEAGVLMRADVENFEKASGESYFTFFDGVDYVCFLPRHIGSLLFRSPGTGVQALLEFRLPPPPLLESTEFQISLDSVTPTVLGELSTTPTTRTHETLASAASGRVYQVALTHDGPGFLHFNVSYPVPGFRALLRLYDENLHRLNYGESTLLYTYPDALEYYFPPGSSGTYYVELLDAGISDSVGDAEICKGVDSAPNSWPVSYNISASFQLYDHYAVETETQDTHTNDTTDTAEAIAPFGEGGLPFALLGTTGGYDVDQYVFNVPEDGLEVTLRLIPEQAYQCNWVIGISDSEGDLEGEIDNFPWITEMGTWTFSSGVNYLSVENRNYGVSASYVLLMELSE
jgi:hypothetical protein